ncbi:hypothetical protein KFK09_028039 [Dendrobium nobile]|uniref:Uncharacterized protein n=1 Tax=Dendrobium nobile TaxID=94219 RepID=A0A8T3A2B4_DENNO|nr:hypothetical protein KFK09_028039 [Dendrobium nobile]
MRTAACAMKLPFHCLPSRELSVQFHEQVSESIRNVPNVDVDMSLNDFAGLDKDSGMVLKVNCRCGNSLGLVIDDLKGADCCTPSVCLNASKEQSAVFVNILRSLFNMEHCKNTICGIYLICM